MTPLLNIYCEQWNLLPLLVLKLSETKKRINKMYRVFNQDVVDLVKNATSFFMDSSSVSQVAALLAQMMEVYKNFCSVILM